MNINCLYNIINQNKFDDIKISIIGGYLNNIKPIQKIKYNSKKNSIKFVSNINKYFLR